jgi:hypothetical protein
MPAYVPDYKNDIFISYAHVDNEPFPGADKGWVTTLINGLKIELGKKLGRTDAYSLWMDYELRGNEAVTADIDEQLNNCATLVLIFSRGYLASSWCLLEMNTFLSKVGSGSGRIFMVEQDFIAPEEKPPGFQDLLGYPFWVRNTDTGRVRTLGIPKPNPDREPEYYQILNELARDLTDKLNQLKNEALAGEPKDDEGLSRLAALKKSRLENEKASLEAEMAGKLKEHESISISLGNPRLPPDTKKRLTDKQYQLEAEAEKLETKIKLISDQLSAISDH